MRSNDTLYALIKKYLHKNRKQQAVLYKVPKNSTWVKVKIFYCKNDFGKSENHLLGYNLSKSLKVLYLSIESKSKSTSKSTITSKQ